MAKGRTISASFLTELDQKALDLCQEISDTLINSITNTDLYSKKWVFYFFNCKLLITK